MENNKKEIVKKGRPKKSEETKLGWLPDTSFSDRQKNLIRKLVASTLNDEEFNLFIYKCLSLKLDPLKGEISTHKRKEHTSYCQNKRSCNCPERMIVIVQRDGYLTIAHRTGQFDGMESDVQFDDKGNPISATCEVWNKSAQHPVKIKVYMREYNTNRQVWAGKPITMIQKVAESQALRKAFNISGVYSPEEIDSWNNNKKELPAGKDDDKLLTEAQSTIVIKLSEGKIKKEDIKNYSQRQAKEKIAELLEAKHG